MKSIGFWLDWTIRMNSRIKLPFKLGDSKKANEIDVNETLRKEDFSLSEVRWNKKFFGSGKISFFSFFFRSFGMDFHINRER